MTSSSRGYYSVERDEKRSTIKYVIKKKIIKTENYHTFFRFQNVCIHNILYCLHLWVVFGLFFLLNILVIFRTR